jgi:galactokinase/galacturonokinase
MTEDAVVDPTTDALKELFSDHFGRIAGCRVVRSPYRVCPLGAHIDHQGGTVLGLAIDRGVTFLWRSRDDGLVRLRSLEFKGEFSFPVGAVPPPHGSGFWGDYCAGAAWALASTGRTLRAGLEGAIGGELPVGGLSSSAAVGLAYGLALRQANGIELDGWDMVRGAVMGENGYVGVSVGLLDPATIYFARAGELVTIDCLRQAVALSAPGSAMPPYAVGIVFSGVPRTLARSGYNNRVAECRQAARRLAELAGRAETVDRLGAITVDEYRRWKGALAPPLAGRAEHYFSENDRVARGLAAWQAGDLAGFGALMTLSGESSVKNYEAGCPEIICLWEALAEERGVYGARFSGGGFGGAVIALVDPERAPSIEAHVRRRYLERFPQCAAGFRAEFRTSAAGLSWRAFEG